MDKRTVTAQEVRDTFSYRLLEGIVAPLRGGVAV